MSDGIVLALEHITKSYGEVAALSDVSLAVRRGEIHAILGDNGAGKTTLLKLLAGLLTPDNLTGTIAVLDQPAVIRSPRDAIKLGIGVVPRRPGIFPGLTIADNIVVGKEMPGLIVNQARIRGEAVKLMEIVGLRLDPADKAQGLAPAQQRLLMIARALSHETRLVVLDEPAAFLTSGQELSQLFRAVRSLAERDIATLYMTRRPTEAVQIGDNISVLRDGEIVARAARADFDETALIQQMQSQRIGDAGYIDYDDLGQPRGWLDGIRSLFTGNRG
jgi:ABC-type sugar transport system ATPase subunit